MNDRVLEQLTSVLEQRKQNAEPDSSYVASLHASGLNKILEKVGEEAFETVLAAKDLQGGNDPKELIGETADLWFHSLVMLSHFNLSYKDVLAELERRFDLSGLEEKASRQK